MSITAPLPLVSPHRFRPLIEVMAKSHFLDPNLVEAVVIQESSGVTASYRYEPGFWARYMAANPDYSHLDPRRYSASYGLMQVMYVVAKEVGFMDHDPEYLFVPTIGLEMGCRKLKQLLAWSKGDVTQALAAYNGGRGGNSKPPYRNAAYAQSVLALLARIREAHKGDAHATLSA